MLVGEGDLLRNFTNDMSSPIFFIFAEDGRAGEVDKDAAE